MNQIKSTSSLLAVIKSGGTIKLRGHPHAPFIRMSTFIPARIVAERPKYRDQKRFDMSRRGLEQALEYLYAENNRVAE